MRVLSLLGAPSAEKHFFAKLLGARLRVPVLATGSLLDTEVAHRTHAGRQIEEARRGSAAGSLLPSKVVLPVVMQAVQGARQSGYDTAILVGAPRSVEQLDMLRNAGVAAEVVHLALPEARATHRRGKRRVCAGCGFPLYPPEEGGGQCVKCGCDDGVAEPLPPSPLDTDAPAVEARCAAWRSAAEPLLQRLRSRGSGLVEVKVLEDAEHTWTTLQLALGLEEAPAVAAAQG
ncbi:hypothetical protein EMIHUDRAFT_96865 [Emiliania huxleyi CCMP1516]|uniref:Adenylate kinase n=3 Tax=Emiliania huxleyi TaxID=2903 RepID=A0A0D3IEE6_EMIH1|nr:hypothetical protein EMIHUDRAFT_96865 [Emiliania huxleyi CCMP1516]EOD09631.1 hypothetical protein EMIHUDRAFT_96865 [Emiliania huxleyi CCMP1516]|eukprot:XP_005762060.1 hypothetical protein EMIHUDRAFT_96865 [Emiliania huxleyi CCMP1516]